MGSTQPASGASPSDDYPLDAGTILEGHDYYMALMLAGGCSPLYMTPGELDIPNSDLGGSSILGLSDGLSEGDSSSPTEIPSVLDPGEFLAALSPWTAAGDATVGDINGTAHLNDCIGTALESCGAYDGLDPLSLESFMACCPTMNLEFDSTRYGQTSGNMDVSSFINAPVTNPPDPAISFDGGSVSVS
ncbi:hypothetical protein VSDG_00959 [Cytospora chrysosperma]|uniref:Uncharacterized protein n=1 Tax=Cytospora chrysosperma TaxID=252740 RepID=A0A423WLF0_CYTCH|nr:hypothetical protein VSDG_00959 [Valsa sordida]